MSNESDVSVPCLASSASLLPRPLSLERCDRAVLPRSGFDAILICRYVLPYNTRIMYNIPDTHLRQTSWFMLYLFSLSFRYPLVLAPSLHAFIETLRTERQFIRHTNDNKQAEQQTQTQNQQQQHLYEYIHKQFR